MFERLDIFRTAGAMARHASVRQAIVAENLAQANTPGYRQRDVASFADSLEDARPETRLVRTRAGHLLSTVDAGAPRPDVVRDAPVGPNDNSVSVETEIMKSAEIRQQHEMALAVYRSALKILRATLSPR